MLTSDCSQNLDKSSTLPGGICLKNPNNRINDKLEVNPFKYNHVNGSMQRTAWKELRDLSK